MEEYKAFLPKGLFVEDDVMPDKESSSSACGVGGGMSGVVPDGVTATAWSNAESFHASNPAVQHPKSCPVNAKLSPTSSGTVLFVKVAHVFETTDHVGCNAFSVIVSQIEEAVQSTNGVLHGFNLTDPGTFTLSWDVAAKCDSACTRAVATAKKKKKKKIISTVEASTCGATSGRLSVGTIGSKTHRGYAGIGKAAAAGHAALAVSLSMFDMLSHCAHPW
eukprot:TRINITY_DN5207_c0_g1_i9.p2 TRINITY_DN5207_c0_g1~~TRINITY_DN5207_c0_g1_i9.p2  ORF type:complete len:220 (+),score=11.53 TRINITY_DN5207_c0_g1_i9:1500-2159(+)